MLTKSIQTLFTTLLVCSALYSQSISVPLFKRDAAQENRLNGLRSKFKMAVLEYNKEIYQQLKSDDYQSFSLSIPTPDRGLSLKLEKSEIFADGFYVSTDKEKKVSYNRGLHYRGTIEGDPNSVVAISMFDDEVAGVINTSSGEKFVIGKSSSLRNKTFMVFDANKSDAPEINCLSEELPTYSKESQLVNVKKLEQRVAGGCVNIYFELGNSVYTTRGGTQPAVDYMTGVFNVVAELYRREGINVRISQIFVWTSTEPYNASASTALTDFGRAKQNTVNGQLAQLVRLKTSGGWSGIAWVNVLCASYGASQASGPYSYAEISNSYNTSVSTPTYSWTTEVVTHELGHNLGSPHTHNCSWTGGAIDNCATTEGGCNPGPTPTNGGTIMSYCHLTNIGINYANGFGPQPSALINNRVAAAACAVACTGGTTCNAPAALNTTNITTSSATLSWGSATGAVSYTVQYKLSTASTWTTAATATTATSVNISGLTAATAYQWQVRTNCTSTNTTYSQASFTTNSTAATCVSAPTALAVGSVTSSSAIVSWGAVSGATSYTVQYKTSAATTWTSLASTTSTSSTISGLLASTLYSWQVRANCSTANSPFATGSFTTSAASICNAPGNLTNSNIASTTVTISWSAVSGVFNYGLQIKTSNTTTWTTLGTTTSTAVNISGLTAGTTYDWRVNTNCSSGSSGYSQSQFTTTSTTPVTCNAPSSISVSGIGTSTATASWSAVSGAVNYTLEIKTTTASTWTTLVSTASTTVNITGLTSSTGYDLRVKTNCSSSASGYAQTSFTTGAVAATCNAPASLTTANISSSGATISWGAVSGAVSYAVEYKTNASATWIVASSAFTGVSFNLTSLTASTLYNFRIKTNCSGSSSTYSSSQFTTAGTVSNTCPGSQDLAANESRTSAQAISKNVNVLGRISPSGDNDYFSFSIAVGGSISITLTTLPADYDLRLYNEAGSTIGLSQNSGTTSESINVSVAAGTYSVRIYGYGGANNGTTCYTLKVQTNTAVIYSEEGTYNPGEYDVKVFPNPVRSWLNYEIAGFKGIAQTAIIDLQGKIHSTAVTKFSANKVNVSTLPSGFYLLRIEDEEKRSKVVKFLKTE